MRRTITPNTYIVSPAALSHPDPHMKPPTPHANLRMEQLPSQCGILRNPLPSRTGRRLGDHSNSERSPLFLSRVVKRCMRDATFFDLQHIRKASEIVPRTSTLRRVREEDHYFSSLPPPETLHTRPLRNAKCKKKRVGSVRRNATCVPCVSCLFRPFHMFILSCLVLRCFDPHMHLAGVTDRSHCPQTEGSRAQLVKP